MHLIVLFPFLIFSIFTDFAFTKSISNCPNEWVEYNNHCYKIFHNQLTSFNAQLAFSSMGAYLVTINDQNEFNFIQSTFYSTISSQIGQVWV